jgi:2-oxoglutarate ferredoxin oxidoreductase subunit alpha
MDRLKRKHKEAAGFVPAPIIERRKGARVGVITLGGCDSAVREALDILAANGTPMDYMRIRAFPFDEPVEAFLAEHDYCWVIEQNRDAQLKSLLILETPVAKDKLRSILVYGGFPLSAKNVLDEIAPALSSPVSSTGQEQLKENEVLDAVNR